MEECGYDRCMEQTLGVLRQYNVLGCGNVDGTWYLYGLYGSIYLHPEVTNVTLIDSYVMKGMEKSYAVMDAEKFLADAARALGTTVGFGNYRCREIESF